MTTKTIRTWLIIRNGNETRLARRRPVNLAPNEVCVEIEIHAPMPPRLVGKVTINLPDPPPVEAEAIAIEYGDENG